uniref:Uncharacterized protein n=1 Tax=Kwoniella pini CBS 10737 TaxID=1296096 RepID=A0A1B9HXP5_9TREE|nr:uncharacterized protein I206_05885 [Kwoniella pini CBS 10737]OCF48018.1 hypothetical protein I206_05885 [Kwoniella pini CBS 10737]
MPIPFYGPSPAPEAVFKDEFLPYEQSSFLSKFLLNWAGPSIRVAWSRAMEADDLYELTPDLQAQLVSGLKSLGKDDG